MIQKPSPARSLFVAASAIALFVASPSAQRSASGSAADLLAKVVAKQETSGFNMRARLEIKTKESAAPTVIQIRAVGKAGGDASRVLYQALWPDALKGHAVIVDRPNRQTTQGMFFTPPDTTASITPARLNDAILGSDMTVEDLAEDHLWWPGQAFAGVDKVGNEACRIVESHRPEGSKASYPLVRSCVSESKMLVLRVEKIRADGKVAKRFTVKRTARAPDGVTTPRTLEVQNLETGSTTTIDVTRGDRGIIVATAEFSMAKLRSLGR